MERRDKITVSDLAAKFKSKAELYNILKREGEIYLPPKQDSTQKFLREVMSGRKLYIKWKKVAVIRVPHYKGLQVRDLLRFASSKVNIEDYLPDYQYKKEPNRKWLWNVINTLVNTEFHEFIEEKVEKRREELIESQNLGIKVKPEFEVLFASTKSVSTMKGKSHFLTRMPKINKDHQKLMELEEEIKEHDSKEIELNRELEALKYKMEGFEDLQKENDENLDKLSNLYKLGVIDENGYLINNKME